MKKIMPILALTIMSFSFSSCSDKNDNDPVIQSSRHQMSGTARKIKEAGQDARQEVCEMVDGDLKCAMERVQRDGAEVVE